ncbi:hypothetical protein [Candidatus Binatus sp.]|uniref:hypothetical protein n=1 Tax=Candidatus Binatus sp. TaxID=2811406 RepID=UPI00272BC39C|nr:hypothetical protein [Candidatus Binatus sp.]
MLRTGIPAPSYQPTRTSLATPLKLSTANVSGGTPISNRSIPAIIVIVVALGLGWWSWTNYHHPTPDRIVLKAFEAFRGNNSAAITELMSNEGRRNADLLCGGAAMNCLTWNYGAFGALSSYSAEVKSKGEKTAEVLLKTSWAAENASLLCQTFQLEEGGEGWAIRFFEPPETCNPAPKPRF